jgi:hypothetical protein
MPSRETYARFQVENGSTGGQPCPMLRMLIGPWFVDESRQPDADGLVHSRTREFISLRPLPKNRPHDYT